MECAILASQMSDLSSLVKRFKRKILPELDRSGFSLSFDRSIGTKKPMLFVFEKLRGSTNRSGYYTATVLFESDGNGQCLITIVVSGGPGTFGSLRAEARILDSIRNTILKLEGGMNTAYDSAWIYDSKVIQRQRAISFLEQIGGDTSVDKIAAILSRDKSDAVLESAALSLGHMRNDRAIDPLIEIAKRKTRLVIACVKALRDIRSLKAFEGLKDLLVYCEQRELVAGAKLIRQAIQGVQFGVSYEEQICIVCDQLLAENEQVVQCPWCKNMAHKLHMLEWLHVHGECPSCGHGLAEADLVERSLQVHQRQQESNSRL